MDPVKYRNLFLEEACAREAIDLVFRMVHSLKGMGASLGYDAVSELSHRLEDRLGAWRAGGGIDDPTGLPLLFRGLESLERMVAVVRETGDPPPPDPELVAALDAAALEAEPEPGEDGAAKKAAARAR